jgi:hypothetical protein
VWSPAFQFFNGYYGRTTNPTAGDNTPWNTFKVMFEKMNELEGAAGK